MLGITLACAAMALKDLLLTFLTVAEAQGRAILAGLLDASSDLATILVTIAGAGLVIQHGWTLHSIAVLAAMMITSFLGTALWTRLAARWITHGEQHDHHPPLDCQADQPARLP